VIRGLRDFVVASINLCTCPNIPYMGGHRSLWWSIIMVNTLTSTAASSRLVNAERLTTVRVVKKNPN